MRPDRRVGGEGRGSKPCVFAQQKRPEPVFGSGRTKHCPWFHLNSPLEAGHFIPDNGGDRRGISAARLKSAALSLPRGLAPTVLSLLRRREKASFSQPFVVRSIARRRALVKSLFRKRENNACIYLICMVSYHGVKRAVLCRRCGTHPCDGVMNTYKYRRKNPWISSKH